MNIPLNNNESGEKPKNKVSKKNKIRITILVFIILTFIVNSLILANEIHTKYVTYNALGSFVQTTGLNDKKAATQGNLGNYNIISKKNSLIDNKNKTYTLTLELEFTNYGEEGRSFAEAVDVTAYQNNKEIKGGVSPEEILTDESMIKVRNGQTAKVVLSYVLTDATQDVNVDMASGINLFTYTVKLTQPKSQQKNKELPVEEETAKEKETEKQKKTEKEE